MKRSAGLLIFRRRGRAVEFFLVHPGGPFWAKKDESAWSIPKGLDQDEDALDAARREFAEETGCALTGVSSRSANSSSRAARSFRRGGASRVAMPAREEQHVHDGVAATFGQSGISGNRSRRVVRARRSGGQDFPRPKAYHRMGVAASGRCRPSRITAKRNDRTIPENRTRAQTWKCFPAFSSRREAAYDFPKETRHESRCGSCCTWCRARHRHADSAAGAECLLPITQFRGWKAPDQRTIYIRVGFDRVYRLDLANTCSLLSFPNVHLITKTRGPDLVCSAVDWDLSVSELPPGNIPEPCIVRKMTLLSAEETAAIPPKFRP